MTPTKTSQAQNNSKNKVWNSERVAECIRMIEDGMDVSGGTPFHEGDTSFKAGEIVYEYTDFELSEPGITWLIYVILASPLSVDQILNQWNSYAANNKVNNPNNNTTNQV